MARRSPGSKIVWSRAAPSGGGPSEARRKTSSTEAGSPMRARSTSPCTTATARSTCSLAPLTVSESPRNETRTFKARWSSTRLPPLTPASSRGSAPSADKRCTVSSVMPPPRSVMAYLEMESTQVGRIDGHRCTFEEGARGRSLRKRDHVAQRPGPGKQHRCAVEPDGEAAVRRRPGGKPVEQKTEALADSLRRDAEQ